MRSRRDAHTCMFRANSQKSELTLKKILSLKYLRFSTFDAKCSEKRVRIRVLMRNAFALRKHKLV